MTSGSTAIARAMHSRCCWPPDRPVPGLWSRRSLTLFPQARLLQRGLHRLVEIGAVRDQAVDARAVGDVLVDRFRERIGLLEHHPDPCAQLHDVLLAIVDVLAVERDAALDPRRFDGVVHAVQAAQERRLAAARRADERDDRVAGDVDADVLDSVLVAVVDVDLARRHDRVCDGHAADGARFDLRARLGLVGRCRQARARQHRSHAVSAGCNLCRRHLSHPQGYQRRSNRLRSNTAAAFMTRRNASSTMIAPDVRSMNARSGLLAHR